MTACIYARFSPRPDGSLIDSIEVQVERCRAYCAAQGWEVIGTFDDQELSGASIEGRSGLASALSLCCQHKAALVVYSLSRLARNTQDAISISQKLHECGGDLVSVVEKLDTTSPAGRLMFTIMAAFAQMEREQTSQRTRDAMRHYQAQGRRMGALPYGWKRDPKDGALMLPCEHERAAIQLMRTLSDQGLSAAEIGAELTARGYKARKRDGQWCRATIGNILKREVVG